jgi:NIMA (never in mitosis gene a)-related kinase
MEYAEGGDLSHRIKAAKAMNAYFTEEEILNWFVQICLGIKHLHDRYALNIV